MTPPPADFATAFKTTIGLIKTGGFPPFVVHVSRGAPLACATYAEAEAHAVSYAERARANVWYVERGRLQLVCSFCHLRQETALPDSHE